MPCDTIYCTQCSYHGCNANNVKAPSTHELMSYQRRPTTLFGLISILCRLVFSARDASFRTPIRKFYRVQSTKFTSTKHSDVEIQRIGRSHGTLLSMYL